MFFMDEHLKQLVWQGIAASNPWWETCHVPSIRSAGFRRHGFSQIYQAFRDSGQGRGVVLLGPRRVGKTVLMHQVVEQLLADQVPPSAICMLSLDDVALRGQDLGALLDLVRVYQPYDGIRYLLLDEIQHSPEWSGWLKRLADRKDPYVFLATGSSAMSLRHGGQDAGVGRWREITLFPWSFREHVQLREHRSPVFDLIDTAIEQMVDIKGGSWVMHVHEEDMDLLNRALIDYLLRGGFPEAALASDLAESRRRLRQDILDRVLGRDIVDVTAVDPRLLERMFLRICLNPGGLWNSTEVANDLGVSRPLVNRYLDVLERVFLVFRFPNLASPYKGQPKIYLVSPSLRQALLGMTEEHLEIAEEWGRMSENAMAAALIGTRPAATAVGFWRKGNAECDGVVINPGDVSEFIETKRSGKKALRGIQRATEGLGVQNSWNVVLTRSVSYLAGDDSGVIQTPLAAWLYQQEAAAGGTLRISV